MILAGDVGGTKTHLALFNTKMQCISEKIYPSRDYKDFYQILDLFLEKFPAKIKKACLGVAGATWQGRSRLTNLPWIIDTQKLKIKQVELINDITANAYGISCLKPKDYLSFKPGKKQIGNKVLLAAGTGLGEGGLYWDGRRYHPWSGEGGHSDFAPSSDLEIELFRFLQREFGHASYERVLSGNGLVQLYDFLTASGIEKKTKLMVERLKKDKTAKTIVAGALEDQDAASMHALEWFSSIYGSESGNMALKFFALGGVYLGGGLAPKILPFVKKNIFIKSFSNKGRFSSFLSDIPVYLILNENTALLGAAAFALRQR